MSKNPSERKGMPGEREDLNRDTQQGQRGQQGQQGQHKQGDRGTGAGQDWKKKEQQKPHRPGEAHGQQGQESKQTDPNKQRNPGGTDTEKTGDRSERTAIFSRCERLGVKEIQMARASDKPDQHHRPSLRSRGALRLRRAEEPGEG